MVDSAEAADGSMDERSRKSLGLPYDLPQTLPGFCFRFQWALFGNTDRVVSSDWPTK